MPERTEATHTTSRLHALGHNPEQAALFSIRLQFVAAQEVSHQ